MKTISSDELRARLAKLTPKEREEAEKLMSAIERVRGQNKLFEMFPGEGEFSRYRYPKHMAFLAAGKDYRERLFLAANRVGKTLTGAYETACHITGFYPDWWEGHRFDRPIKAWCAGDTGKTVRDIIQAELLGDVDAHGTGMIPGQSILRVTPKSGIPDAVDSIFVEHHNTHGEVDGVSQLGLKSYDQGRIAFQGTAQDLIWLDEECPPGVYEECLIRTMTTKGLLFTTFTPLKGMTEVVMMYLESETAVEIDPVAQELTSVAV